MMQLQKFRNKGLTFNEMVNLESLKDRDPQIRTISPIQVFGTAEIDSKKSLFTYILKVNWFCRVPVHLKMSNSLLIFKVRKSLCTKQLNTMKIPS